MDVSPESPVHADNPLDYYFNCHNSLNQYIRVIIYVFLSHYKVITPEVAISTDYKGYRQSLLSIREFNL